MGGSLLQRIVQLPTEVTVPAVFAAALVLLATVGAASARSIGFLRDSFLWVDHSQQVLTRLADVSASLRAVESAQRGFVISGNDEFLAHFGTDIGRVEAQQAELRGLTRDNPAQQRSLASLSALVSRRIAFSRDVIVARQQEGRDAAEQLIAAGTGLELQGRIEDILLHMRRIESELLAGRRQDADARANRALALIVAAGSVAALLLALAYLRIRADLAGRVRNRVALQEANASLDAARLRAEAADRAKSAFLATMSHELRTPLNSIIGFTAILAQGKAGPVNDVQAKQLGIVQNSSRHLLALINDILDLSKIEAGELRIRPAAFDLGDSIGRLVDSVRPQADRKGLALRVDVPASLPPAWGDQRRVEQVLLNLLSNAVKFTPAGEVRLRVAGAAAPVPDTEFAGTETGARGWVALTVTDTGIGIAAEDLAALFRPFMQVDSSLGRQYEGTGLGLGICRRLVELMGGRIAVHSEPGCGSRFTVELPLLGGATP